MRKSLIVPVVAALVTAPALAHDGPEPHPELFNSPIAGVQNNYWFDYRSDIEEAEAELRKDLRRVTDAEDRNDAWREYVREIDDANADYAGEMEERGYRTGRVTVGD